MPSDPIETDRSKRPSLAHVRSFRHFRHPNTSGTIGRNPLAGCNPGDAIREVAMQGSSTSDHPAPELLKAFGDGELGVEAALRVQDHLNGCPDCRQILQLPAADTVSNRPAAAPHVAEAETLPPGPARAV